MACAQAASDTVNQGTVVSAQTQWLDLVQWPAMLVTVWAAWLVDWGLHSHDWALLFLQVCLAAMNVRGASQSEPAAATSAK